MDTILFNISPLPFYDSKEEWNSRKNYAFGNVFPLLCTNALIPFQFIVPEGYEGEVLAWLVDYNTGGEIDISKDMADRGLFVDLITLKGGETANLVRYPAISGIPKISANGPKYLKLELIGHQVLYSDVFYISDRASECLMLEWSNDYDLMSADGPIVLSDKFTFRCYLDTQLGKPDYDFEEEVTERMGYSFIESQVSKKTYKFVAVIPEYLCDALRIVRLCNKRRITNKGKVYRPITFSMDVDWEEQGDLASATFEFDTDNIIANLGGVRSETSEFNGDFNNDFNI